MRLLRNSGRRWSILLLGGLALALLSSSAASAPAPARTGPAKLTFRLAALSAPDVRSASRATQAADMSLPARGPGSLLRVNGNPLVQIRTDGTSAATRKALEAAGARIVNVSAKYHTFTAAVPAANLQRIAAVGGVQAVTDILTPMTSSWGAGISAVRSTCPQGTAVSEGDVQLRANVARSTYHVNGHGVKVGILSDSFNTWTTAPTHAATDSASGDLPGVGNTCGFTTPVQLIDDSVAGEDEGRGMAQIVHDLAPGASLAFATAFTSELGFAANINALKAAGAKVIVDDVTYFDEPFFQDGPVAVAVNTVTGGGATYFSSAANNNIASGTNSLSSFEAPVFRDSASCPLGSPSYATHCMDFNPTATVDNTYGISVPNGRTLRIDVQWAQPWFGVTTDNDAYLISSTNVLLAKSEYFNVTTSKTPFEFLSWTNATGATQNVNFAINRYSGTGGGDTGTPRIKLVFVENGAQNVVPTEYIASSGGDTVGPSIFGHNGAANTMSTAAVPYNNSAAPESYSSQGPVTLYYGPVNGTTPAAAITPQVLAKPDIAATDGGANTFFGSFVSGVWRFYGTSAAAPHAAAVAALELQAKPTATVAQVKNAQTSTAKAIGAFTHPAVGAGLLDAKAAVGKLAKCTVPNVIGKTLDAAKTAIKKAKCAVGSISHARSRKKKGTVISQSPGAGRTVAAATKVNLLVSRGRR